LDSDDAGADHWAHHFQRQDFDRAVVHAGPAQACTCEHHGVEPVLGVEASDAGVDVAADPVDVQIWALAQDLCLAAYGRGADAGAGRPQHLGSLEGLRQVHRGPGRDREAAYRGSSSGLKLWHVFGTATRRHPLTAEHNRTHNEQRPTSFMQVGRCFASLREWAGAGSNRRPSAFQE
jgi:hypothetical protein